MKTLLLASWCLFCGHDPESDLRSSLNYRFIETFEFKGGTRKELINSALEKLQEKMGERKIIPKDFAGQSDEWLETEIKDSIELEKQSAGAFLRAIANAGNMEWSIQGGVVTFTQEPRFGEMSLTLEPGAATRHPDLFAHRDGDVDWARTFFCDAEGTPRSDSGFTTATLPTIHFDPLLRKFDLLVRETDRERLNAYLLQRFPRVRSVQLTAVWTAVPRAALDRLLEKSPALSQEQLLELFHAPERRILATQSIRLPPEERIRVRAGEEPALPPPPFTHPSAPGRAAETGVELEARAELPDDGTSIRIALEAELSDPRPPREEAGIPSPPDDGAGTRPAARRVFKHETSFTCVDGGTVVLGGHTTPADREAVFLYLTASIETPTTPPPATDPP